MSWNTARVSFLPPGRKPVLDVSDSARTSDGSPVRIIGAARNGVGGEEDFSARSFRAWLEENGFRLARESACAASFGRRDVEVFVAIDEKVVSEVILEFKLDSQSAFRISEWEDFIGRLHHDWRLQLVDAQVGVIVAPEEFRRLLADNGSWQEFSAAYSWPAIDRALQNCDDATNSAADANQAALSKDDADLAAAMLPVMEQTLREAA